jgi:ribonuclease HII
VSISGVDDSKKLNEEQRERVYAELMAQPRVKYAVAIVDHAEIDKINILQASMLAMQRAVESME